MENQKLLETIVNHLVDLRKDMSEIKQDVSELKQDVSELKQDVSELKQDVSELKQDVSELKQRQSNLEQSVARIEHDHGTKLAALLDGYRHNAEILNNHTERLDRIEAKIETHDIQISVLDRTKSNRRRAK